MRLLGRDCCCELCQADRQVCEDCAAVSTAYQEAMGLDRTKKAVVIVGGSDKGQWAKRLASDTGRYAEISAEILLDKRQLCKVIIETKPKTLIVNNMIWSEFGHGEVKKLISEEVWSLINGHRACMVEACRLIFLHDGAFTVESSRRFTVLRATDQGLVPG